MDGIVGEYVQTAIRTINFVLLFLHFVGENVCRALSLSRIIYFIREG